MLWLCVVCFHDSYLPPRVQLHLWPVVLVTRVIAQNIPTTTRPVHYTLWTSTICHPQFVTTHLLIANTVTVGVLFCGSPHYATVRTATLHQIKPDFLPFFSLSITERIIPTFEGGKKTQKLYPHNIARARYRYPKGVAHGCGHFLWSLL